MSDAEKALHAAMLALFRDNDGDFQVKVEDSSGPRTFNVLSSLLRKRSDVFNAMLSHDLAESRDKSVTLAGIGSLEVELFLQFIYTGQVALEASVIVGLSTLSDKYQVHTLVDVCAAWLGTNMTPDNVFTIYNYASQDSANITLAQDCLLFVDSNASAALSHMHILLDDQIHEILSRESFCIAEQELIEGLLVWAEKGKKSSQSVATFLQQHTNPENADKEWTKQLRPRLEKQQLCHFLEKSSTPQNHAVHADSILGTLVEECIRYCTDNNLNDEIVLHFVISFWINVIPGCPKLFNCAKEVLGRFVAGKQFGNDHISFQHGDSVVFFLPHRRVRPSAFRVDTSGISKPDIKISASANGSEWTTLVADASECTPRKDGRYACRSWSEFKYFKVEALAPVQLKAFDISGVLFAN